MKTKKIQEIISLMKPAMERFTPKLQAEAINICLRWSIIAKRRGRRTGCYFLIDEGIKHANCAALMDFVEAFLEVC